MYFDVATLGGVDCHEYTLIFNRSADWKSRERKNFGATASNDGEKEPPVIDACKSGIVGDFDSK